MQTEIHYKTGQLILTCFLLPQTNEHEHEGRTSDPQQSHQLQQQQERHICFKEANSANENFARLMRAPTPYPKDLQRYQRSATNILKRQKQVKSKFLLFEIGKTKATVLFVLKILLSF